MSTAAPSGDAWYLDDELGRPAPPAGLEPATSGLEVQCSIQLSYGGVERVTGIEPASPAWKAGALPLSYTRGVAGSVRVTIGFVGPVGFEPTTSCSQSTRANQAALRPVDEIVQGR